MLSLQVLVHCIHSQSVFWCSNYVRERCYLYKYWFTAYTLSRFFGVLIMCKKDVIFTSTGSLHTLSVGFLVF